MTGDSNQESYEQTKEQMYKLEQAVMKARETLLKIFDYLEPYQKFEVLHPKKKPRGSIRRRKRGMI